MTKNEMSAVTEKWLHSKGFIKNEDIFVRELEGFDVCVMFVKERFWNAYYFSVGFQLKGDEDAWGHVRTNLKGAERYEYANWSKEDYISSLEEMHAVYIQPYFDLGFEMLMKIIKKQKFKGEQYLIHGNAIEKISKM